MQIKCVLFFLLFQVLELNSSEIAKKPKFSTFVSKSFPNKNEDKVSAGPFCQSITAYFAGQLTNNKSAGKIYDVQFQVKLWADEDKKKIHVYVDKWNEKYSNSQDFELDFYYDRNRQWCDIYDDDCNSKFAKANKSTFTLDLNAKDGNYYHLLFFNNFNNSFALNSPVDQCTKHQLDNLNDENTPDLHKLSQCVCCGEYEPNSLLGCPCNEWRNRVHTCPNIVAYFEGTFQWPRNRSYTFDAQFQAKFYANQNDETIYYGIDQWNQTYLDGEDDKLIIDFDSEYSIKHRIYQCDTPGKNCSIPFVNMPTPDWYFGLLEFPIFFNNFTLYNTVGKCTKYQLTQSGWAAPFDPSLISYCVCCGEYKPHPSLNCPKNPWA